MILPKERAITNCFNQLNKFSNTEVELFFNHVDINKKNSKKLKKKVKCST